MKRNLLSTVLLFCVSLFLPHTLFAQDESKVETYNFQSFISSCTKEHGLVLGGATGISVNGSELTYVADFTKENYNTLRNVSFEFSTNGRFAVYGGFEFHRNRYETYRVRAAGDGRIFSILNLNAGDKVSLITNAGTGGEPATGIAFLSDNAKLEGEENNVSVGDLLQSGVTYVITDGQNHLDLSLSSNNGFQQIVITPNPNVEVVSTPSINVVGAYDGQRTIEIVSGASSFDDNSVKSYYTLNGEVPSSSSNEYVSPFTIEETTTIRVISISSSGKASMVLAHEVEAGTVLQLAAPEVGLVGMELAPTGSLYNPKYGFTADNSSVIGNPESSFTCSFVSVAGDVINVGKATDFVFSVPGTLTVTASADGYADSKTDFTVDVVNYSVMKQHRVIGVLIEAGSLYSIAHTEQHYQSPSLKSQVAAAIQHNMPYGLYATVRSRSVTEAKKELYELSLIIRTYLPLLGVWLQIQFTSGVSTNDSIMDEYYRQLVDIGMQGQIGVYASRNQLNKITWDNYCNEIFLLLDEHVDSMNDINQLLTPEFFSL